MTADYTGVDDLHWALHETVPVFVGVMIVVVWTEIAVVETVAAVEIWKKAGPLL